MAAYLLFVPMTLALAVALRNHSPGLVLVAATFFFLGVAAFYSTNTTFAMRAIAGQYDAAVTDADRARLLAASQTLVTVFKTQAFMVSYVIVSIAWLLFAWAMRGAR